MTHNTDPSKCIFFFIGFQKIIHKDLIVSNFCLVCPSSVENSHVIISSVYSKNQKTVFNI